MSASVTNAFIAQYSSEVKQAFQQKGSKLKGLVRSHSNVVGSTHNFHKLAAVVANTKARGADVTGLDPTSAQVTATLADYYAPIYLDKLDELKTNANMRGEYVTAAANAISRKIDDVIITALDAATNTTTTTAGGLTIAKILEGLTYLNAGEVDPEDRILLIGSKQLSDALAITQLTSADYMNVQTILKAGVGAAFGFNWVVSNRLPLNVANRTCFAFNRQSVGLAIGQDLKSELNYVPEKVSWLATSTVSLGAVIIENAGITKLICAE